MRQWLTRILGRIAQPSCAQGSHKQRPIVDLRILSPHSEIVRRHRERGRLNQPSKDSWRDCPTRPKTSRVPAHGRAIQKVLKSSGTIEQKETSKVEGQVEESKTKDGLQGRPMQMRHIEIGAETEVDSQLAMSEFVHSLMSEFGTARRLFTSAFFRRLVVLGTYRSLDKVSVFSPGKLTSR